MRQLIFLWRSNISGITLDISLCASLFLQMKIECIIVSSEKKQALTFLLCFRRKSSTSLFLQRKMKCLTTSSKKSAFFQRHSEALHSFSKEISKNSKVFYFFWRNIKKNNLANVVATIKNKAPHYFFRRMKCLVLSSEKNPVPH